jgi:hypothetical protein
MFASAVFNTLQCKVFLTLLRSTALAQFDRAILVALAYPEAGNRWRSDSKSETDRVHPGALSQARCIVKWCPEDILASFTSTA